MTTICKIRNYTIVDEIICLSEDIKLYLAENEISGKEFEILIIRSSKSQTRKIKRIIDNEVKILIDSNYNGIQKVIECIEESECFCIVYEKLNKIDIHKTRDSFEQCIEVLDTFKKENIKSFILNKDTFYLDNHKLKLRFIGLLDIFRLLDIDICRQEPQKKTIKNDIESLAFLFKEYLNGSIKRKIIYKKCLNKEYIKYSELKDDIENIEPERNEDFIDISIAIDDRKYDIDELLIKLNKVFYFDIKKDKSTKGEVEIYWSTKEISGKAFVAEKDGYLFIPHFNDYPDLRIITLNQKGQFNFQNKQLGYSNLNSFIDKFDEINKLTDLTTTKSNSIDTWKALPDKEKEHIEEQAFKASYMEVCESEKNNQNIIFTLEDTFKDWDTIKDKKNNNIILSIDDIDIGKILDYEKNSNSLTIKDSKVDIKTISPTGKLIEDVRQLTSQYKKQIEACERFTNKDIVNPDLAGFIATPEVMPSPSKVTINYDEFSKKIINDKLKNDETQKNAVIDAIHKKPIYLIQGPPGTGKTTVIIEMIEQLINQNKDIKILVVSQSNLAVDNVLERLLSMNILFTRLASENAMNGDGISRDIKKHLFENKIKVWVEESINKSDENIKNKFPITNEVLVNFYTKLQVIKKENIKEVEKEYKSGKGSNYLKKLFHHCKTISDIEKICIDELGNDFCIHHKLQKEWKSFINNASSKKNKSTLNNGSKPIDLQTALMKKINVFGSTCIHIASRKYSKIDFKFDYMIMDESSKATHAEALVPIAMSKNIILIGDHHQLPPMITRESIVKDKIKKHLDDDGLDINKTYGKSLFEELIVNFENSHQLCNYKTMLDIQYRMPRQLGYLISKHIYDGQLKSPDIDKFPDYDKEKYHKLKLKNPYILINDEKVLNSIIFISTSKQDDPYDNDNIYKRKNNCNAEIIKETLKTLKEELGNKLNIGIIASYRGQVELLKNKLFSYKQHINTVDKFQGAERDIIIYDIVKSSSGNSNIGFLDDYRRINVAFSRAKKLLIVVGDSEYILKRAKNNPHSDTKKLVIKSMTEQLEEWGCIYDSLKEAIK